jgi:hypothetical protein
MQGHSCLSKLTTAPQVLLLFRRSIELANPAIVYLSALFPPTNIAVWITISGMILATGSLAGSFSSRMSLTKGSPFATLGKERNASPIFPAACALFARESRGVPPMRASLFQVPFPISPIPGTFLPTQPYLSTTARSSTLLRAHVHGGFPNDRPHP